MRSKHGLAVPYQCLTTFDTGGCFRDSAFPRLTSFWRRIEMRHACPAELPPVYTYKAEEFMDPNSGWWVVAYTELVLCVISFLLYEAYENVRISAVSPDLIRLTRDLDLETPLGSIQNAAEALWILTVIKSTLFDSLPERWCQRGSYQSGSVGRVRDGAYFIYYNMHQNRAVAENNG